MKRLFTIFITLLLLPVLISQKPPRNGNKDYVDGEIMIQFKPIHDKSVDQMTAKLQDDFKYIDLEQVRILMKRFGIVLLKFSPDILPDPVVLSEIKKHPLVRTAQFNHFVELRQTIPSDQYFNLQWNMHNTGQSGGVPDADIDGPEAWDISHYGVTALGDTIIVAIVDDGFDIGHEDIKFWKNWRDIPNNNIDDDQNGYIDDYDGWNAFTHNGSITQADHGTHVTGIAAAWGDNDKGVTGVNWRTRVMPVVGSSEVEAPVVEAYGYIYEMRHRYNETNGEEGAFVVSTNASFGVNQGQPEDYPLWGAMYDSLGSIGVLSAAATANAAWNIDEVGDIPTAFPSDFLISVTNTTRQDELSSFAGYGPTTIDLGAPGTEIYSTRQNSAYGNKTGCSMASPHVAGAVAYMFSVADSTFMVAYRQDPSGKALDIKQYILDGVDSIADLTGLCVSGGRLNIYNSAMLMIQDMPPSVNVTTDHDSLCRGMSAQLTAHVTGGSGNYTYTWISEPAGFTSTEANPLVTPNVTTTYNVQVSDGNNVVEDEISIIVFPKPLISLGPDTTLCYYHEISLDAGNPGYTYIWSTGETTRNIIADSTGMNQGAKEIWVQVTSPDNCISSDTLKISFIECLGIDESNGMNIAVYPNPGDGRFILQMNNKDSFTGDIRVLNVSGILVYKKMQLEILPGDHTDLDLSKLPHGIYMLQVAGKLGIYRTQLIISK